MGNPKTALKNLIKITKKVGEIYLSSLFNVDYDVDVYSKVFDHTRKSSNENNYFNYNTYSKKTINTWIASKVESLKFTPEADFNYDGR